MECIQFRMFFDKLQRSGQIFSSAGFKKLQKESFLLR